MISSMGFFTSYEELIQNPHDELVNLGEYLAGTFPREAEGVTDALCIAPKYRHRTLARAVNGAIRLLFELQLQQPCHHAPPRSAEDQTDHGLRCAQRTFEHMTEEKWRHIAEQKNRPVEEVRRNAWAHVARGFIKYD